jgi:hypothetical protein
VQKICGDIGFNFTDVSSFETWTAAALRGRGAAAYSALQARFDLSDVPTATQSN